MKKKYFKSWIAAAIILALILTSASCGLNQLEHGLSADDKTNPETSATTDLPENIDTVKTTNFAGADSYESIYSALKKMEEDREKLYDKGSSIFDFAGIFNTGQSGGAAMEDAEIAVEETAAATDSSSSDYSSTNIQELGVDEADIIKTDGKYLYILKNSGSIQIVSAEGKDSKIVSTIIEENPQDSCKEMYVDGDTLQLIAAGNDSSLVERDKDIYEIDSNYYTKLYTYDISDRANPKLSGQIKQEGDYFSSRKTGDIVYLFTEFYPEIQSEKNFKDYIPEGNTGHLEPGDICLPDTLTSTGYLVISSVNAKSPSRTLDEKAILSADGNCYVSTENIYIYNTDWHSGTSTTQLMKFHYKNGKITAVDATNLNGYVNDSFSLNEYKGNLRIVLTENGVTNETNSLYVLDENLSVCGSIRDIASGETIQSARFMGDIGYFVTFRNMDPLFSVDLSNPQNPKILGELKVTGFSSYLHFYGDNRLLGVGEEIDEKTGEYYGIKLSMFDTSNNKNVTEENKYVLKNMYDCSLLYDYKSVMIDPEKNVLGFICDGNYMIFTYDQKKGFKNVFTQPLPNESYYSYNSARGCYVKDTFYLIMDEEIQIYDMENNYKVLGKVEL